MRDYSAALAIRLQKVFHLKFADCIAVCLPNIPEFPIAVLGGIEAGLLITTVNPIYTAGKLIFRRSFLL
jgi:acyl-CoA synthetase (AMP-forming)/AMP-acid ligase II